VGCDEVGGVRESEVGLDTMRLFPRQTSSSLGDPSPEPSSSEPSPSPRAS
jgi:hypothetical protein